MDYVHLRDSAAAGSPAIRYREVAPFYDLRRPPPDLFLGPVPPEFGAWFFNDRSTPGVGLFAVDDVAVHANTLLIRDGAALYLPENGLHPAAMHGAIEQAEAARDLPIVAIENETVLLAGGGHTVFGHWLVDYLPRLHVLAEAGYDPAACRYLLPADLPPFAIEWLGRLGIDRSQLTFFEAGREICAVRRALIPSNLRGNGRASPLMAAAGHWCRDRIIGGARPPTRDIYLSRQGWGSKLRELQNAETIEAIAAGSGYEIVHPEALGIDALLELFASARRIAGEYGSALHGSIFAGPQTSLIALRPTTGHPGFLQSGLCEALGQTHGYVFGSTETSGEAMAFTVDPEAFRLCLDLLMQPASDAARS